MLVEKVSGEVLDGAISMRRWRNCLLLWKNFYPILVSQSIEKESVARDYYEGNTGQPAKAQLECKPRKTLRCWFWQLLSQDEEASWWEFGGTPWWLARWELERKWVITLLKNQLLSSCGNNGITEESTPPPVLLCRPFRFRAFKSSLLTIVASGAWAAQSERRGSLSAKTFWSIHLDGYFSCFLICFYLGRIHVE